MPMPIPIEAINITYYSLFVDYIPLSTTCAPIRSSRWQEYLLARWSPPVSGVSPCGVSPC